MRVASLLASLLFASASWAQQCAPTTAFSRQFRTAMKHRAPAASDARSIALTDVLAWPPPAGVADYGLRARDAPIDSRELLAVTIEADLWQLKLERNDCDLHLELSAPGAGRSAPRLIAEIPPGAPFIDARQAVLRALPTRGGIAPRRAQRLSVPLRLRLTGYVFWDGAHWCPRDSTRGCGHGTDAVANLWELHPVWRVEVVSGVADPPTIAPPNLPAPPPAAVRRVTCCDGWVSSCPCGHPPRMHCCRGHRGECGCGGRPDVPGSRARPRRSRHPRNRPGIRR